MDTIAAMHIVNLRERVELLEKSVEKITAILERMVQQREDEGRFSR